MEEGGQGLVLLLCIIQGTEGTKMKKSIRKFRT